MSMLTAYIRLREYQREMTLYLIERTLEWLDRERAGIREGDIWRKALRYEATTEEAP